jgi:hypothetical protein
VRAQDASGALLPNGWAIDNYYPKGSPDGPLEAKEFGAYKMHLNLDTDGDGRYDESVSMPAYDLRFVHRTHSGVIWLRTVPLSEILREKDLRVLMQEYIDDVAGAGYEVVNFEDANAVSEKRFAAELLAREEGTLGGRPAYAAEFAVANIDQIHVARDARRSHVKVVLVRPGFDYGWGTRGGGGLFGHNLKLPKKEVPREGPAVKFPVLMIAGLASLPEDFPKALPDFDALLNRVTVSGRSGVALTAVGRAELAAINTSPAPVLALPAASAEPATTPSPNPTPETVAPQKP